MMGAKEASAHEQPVHDTLNSKSPPLNDSLRGDSCANRSEVIFILLIRHAESVDNVRKNYSGTTDSLLTNHGVLQAEALATSLVKNDAHYITHIAASTLTRAHQTATTIHKAARDTFHYPEGWDFTVTRWTELMERDFGSLEGKSYLKTHQPLRREADPKPFFPSCTSDSVSKTPNPSSSSSPSGSSEDRYKGTGSESLESLSSRANAFIDLYLLPAIHGPPTTSLPRTKTIAIVSHGILLATLFRELVARFRTIIVSPEASKAGFIVGKTPSWENTGYTVLRLHSPVCAAPETPVPLPSSTQIPTQSQREKLHHELLVKEVNVTRHLKELKRTRGGIGSAPVDPKQRSITDYIPKGKAGSQKPAAEIKCKRGGDALEFTQPPPPPPPLSEPPRPPFDFPDSSVKTDASTEDLPASPLPEEVGAGAFV